jgi:hypothetical protein
LDLAVAFAPCALFLLDELLFLVDARPAGVCVEAFEEADSCGFALLSAVLPADDAR